MKTETSNDSAGRLTSPNFQFRNSETLWGSLQIQIIRHKEGAEHGYLAGQEAYQQITAFYGSSIGFLSKEDMAKIMDSYLTRPRYRPRQWTSLIEEEWRAMFILGWTSQMLITMHNHQAHTTTDESKWEHPPLEKRAHQ